MKLTDLQRELQSLANPKKAKELQRFFKTGPGDYGEGDIFYGLTVPVTRSIAKKYFELTLLDAEKLLQSKIHEERLCALLLLVHQYEQKTTTEEIQKAIFEFYLKNAQRINNWDLVDLSSHEIVGAYLFNHPKECSILKELAKSENLWEKRIAMVSTYHFIYRKRFDEALEVAELLQKDEHDLIHKAVGWMLREIGKRDVKVLENFLKKHYKEMPRTMLRYSIEKFSPEIRQKYLKGTV